MKAILFLILVSVAAAQDYGPFDLGTRSGSVTFDVATPNGTLVLTANSGGGGTGGRNYAFSEARNGSVISGWGNERVTFSGVTDTRVVAVYYWWVSLSEDGSWGYYDTLNVSVRLAAPVNHAPSVEWIAAPNTAANGASYYVAARGHDEDGNLTQVNVWKNGTPFAFAGGGDGTRGDSGNWTSDSGPQTVTYAAQAVDAEGAASGVISFTVTIDAPAPTFYTLTTSAGAGGTVSAGGTFTAGSAVTIAATPDATHDFAGWSGDAGGTANPVSVVLDRDKAVRANFSVKTFALVTSALTGGSVSPGGTYPWGSVVTVTANAGPNYYFTGWSGDASGTSPIVSVYLDRAKTVQAQFAAKASQTISFGAIPDQRVGGKITLSAVSSAGLPVSFAVLGGSAVLNGAELTLTGPGPVSVQASQAGDAVTLAAPSVTRSFNSTVAAAAVSYRSPARTVLSGRRESASHYVLGNP